MHLSPAIPGPSRISIKHGLVVLLSLGLYSTMLALFSVALALLIICYFQREVFLNMADEAADWLQGKVLGWMPAPPTNKIDTHHHYVPSFYSTAVENAGGEYTLSSQVPMLTQF